MSGAQGPGVCCEAKQTVEKQGEKPQPKARDPTKDLGLGRIKTAPPGSWSLPPTPGAGEGEGMHALME